LLKADDVFYDLGANAGFFSLIAARLVGSQGRVVAFEPDAGNYACISEQFQVNQLSNCTIVPRAVSSGNGTIRFERGKSSATGRAIFRPNSDVQGCTVETVSLDSFIREGNPVPNVIKMDVEGAEVEVLKGARQLLSSRRPSFIIEIHRGCADSVARILTEAEYAIFDMEGRGLTHLPETRQIIAISGSSEQCAFAD
jgi:FkbM family methyltransferase